MKIKKFGFSILFTVISFTLFSLNPHITSIPVSSEKSTVSWKGSKLTGSHFGTINIDKGVLLNDHGKLVGGQFSINMHSIICTDIDSKKKNEYLVSHLKNEDFFDVEKYPQSVLTITEVENIEGDDYYITADLTIKGITHPINFNANVIIKDKSFTATTKIIIDRTKWGVVYKSGNIFKDLGDKAIYDDIEFTINLFSNK